jgi:hypothetical protein
MSVLLTFIKYKHVTGLMRMLVCSNPKSHIDDTKEGERSERFFHSITGSPCLELV